MPLEAGDEGKALARVTFGIKGTSMPSWGEFLPLDQRWDAIKYLIEAFRLGKPVTASVAGNGEVAADFATISPDNWTGEGHEISLSRGADVFFTYCATCHGSGGWGRRLRRREQPQRGPGRVPGGPVPQLPVLAGVGRGARQRDASVRPLPQRRGRLERRHVHAGTPPGGTGHQGSAVMPLGLWLLVGWMIFMALVGIAFIVWGWRKGQFRNIEEAKYKMLEDIEPQPWPRKKGGEA